MGYNPSSSGLLDPLKPWMDDPEVTEILLNRPKEIFVEKRGRMQRHCIPQFDSITLHRLFQLIANENQQILNAKMPLLSGSLLNGFRIQLVLPPTAKYHCFAIRRKSQRRLSLRDYMQSNWYQHTIPYALDSNHQTLSQEDGALLRAYQAGQWDACIRQAITLRKNIVISGGTSTGKTTFLNACIAEIPKSERIILLEDTREIEIPHHNKLQLLASKGEQALAHVTMQDLVQCSLRLRPDRIIVGEIRGKEVLDFVSASGSGHQGTVTSIHASTPKLALMRMCQLYKLNAVPAMSDADILGELHSVIDMVIQLIKTPSGRRVQSIYYKSSL